MMWVMVLMMYPAVAAFKTPHLATRGRARVLHASIDAVEVPSSPPTAMKWSSVADVTRCAGRISAVGVVALRGGLSVPAAFLLGGCMTLLTRPSVRLLQAYVVIFGALSLVPNVVVRCILGLVATFAAEIVLRKIAPQQPKGEPTPSPPQQQQKRWNEKPHPVASLASTSLGIERNSDVSEQLQTRWKSSTLDPTAPPPRPSPLKTAIPRENRNERAASQRDLVVVPPPAVEKKEPSAPTDEREEETPQVSVADEDSTDPPSAAVEEEASLPAIDEVEDNAQPPVVSEDFADPSVVEDEEPPSLAVDEDEDITQPPVTSKDSADPSAVEGEEAIPFAVDDAEDIAQPPVISEDSADPHLPDLHEEEDVPQSPMISEESADQSPAVQNATTSGTTERENMEEEPPVSLTSNYFLDKNVAKESVHGTWRIEDGVEIVLEKDGRAQTSSTLSTETTWSILENDDLRIDLKCPRYTPSGSFGGTSRAKIQGRVLDEGSFQGKLSTTILGMQLDRNVTMTKTTNVTPSY